MAVNANQAACRQTPHQSENGTNYCNNKTASFNPIPVDPELLLLLLLVIAFPTRDDGLILARPRTMYCANGPAPTSTAVVFADISAIVNFVVIQLPKHHFHKFRVFQRSLRMSAAGDKRVAPMLTILLVAPISLALGKRKSSVL